MHADPAGPSFGYSAGRRENRQADTVRGDLLLRRLGSDYRGLFVPQKSLRVAFRQEERGERQEEGVRDGQFGSTDHFESIQGMNRDISVLMFLAAYMVSSGQNEKSGKSWGNFPVR